MEEKRQCYNCKYGEFVDCDFLFGCGYICHLTIKPRAFGLTRRCVYNDDVFKKLETIKKKKINEEKKIFFKGFFIGILTVIIIIAIIGGICWLFV